MQGYKYKGCYKDTAARTLGKGGGVLSVESCAKRAAMDNAKYMGVQWWEGDNNKNTGECRWGDKFLRNYGKASNCIKNGLNNYIGGSWANAIYERSLPPPPAPKPTPPPAPKPTPPPAPKPTPASTPPAPKPTPAPTPTPTPTPPIMVTVPPVKMPVVKDNKWGLGWQNMALIGGFVLIGIMLLIIVILIIIKLMGK